MKWTTPLIFLQFLITVPVLMLSQTGHLDRDDLTRRIVMLRQPLTHAYQSYDDGGNLKESNSKRLPEPSDRMWITSTRLSKDRLVLEGRSIRLTNSSHSGPDDLRLAEDSVKLEIHFKVGHGQAVQLNNKLNTALNRILAAKVGLGPFQDLYWACGGLADTCKPADSMGRLLTLSLPKKISGKDPEFSEQARKAKYQGVVTLQITITTQGEVISPVVIRPLGLGLDEKAIEAVRAWKYEPAKINGQPMAMSAMVDINFRLY